MDYKGIIIEESLSDKGILQKVKILNTEVEPVTAEHQTPWLKQWTMHTVEIPEVEADSVAEAISQALESEHNWYADFKNDKYHYIVYRAKVFKVDRQQPDLYQAAKEYGISLGIPEYQVDFSPQIK